MCRVRFTTGLYGPARETAVSNLFPDHDDTAFGAVLAAGSVGSAVLPALAGRAVGVIGWRLTLGLALPSLLLVGAAAWWSVPPRATDPPSTDGVEFGELQAVVANRSILVATAAMTLMIFTFQRLTAFLPTYLIAEKGLGQGTAAALFSVMFLSGAGFQLFGAPLAERYGECRVLVAVAAVGVATVAAFPLVEGIAAIGALVAVLGSRMVADPVTNAFIIGNLPDAEEGSAWGLLRTVMFLIAATGSTLVGRSPTPASSTARSSRSPRSPRSQSDSTRCCPTGSDRCNTNPYGAPPRRDPRSNHGR